MTDLAQQMRGVCRQHYDRGWWHGWWVGVISVTIGHVATAIALAWYR